MQTIARVKSALLAEISPHSWAATVKLSFSITSFLGNIPSTVRVGGLHKIRHGFVADKYASQSEPILSP